jgi:hypothetical protein
MIPFAVSSRTANSFPVAGFPISRSLETADPLRVITGLCNGYFIDTREKY